MSGQPPGSADLPAAPSAAFGPGSRVAGYVIEERLGAGGMAVVYRAHDQRLGRRVALKVLAPALAADTAFRQRFIRESRAAAAVDDPHIIPVFEAGEAAGVLFIAMRFVSGGDVHSLMRAGGPLPAEHAAQILSQVASALDAAHRHGLVHRDVKPANMLTDVSSGHDRPDHIYLSDFGLSKGTASVGGLTASGTFLGTPDYMAPEQIEGKPVDGRTDQYALACAAFEMLAGVTPFSRDQTMATIWAHVSEPPPPLTSLRPDLSPRVDHALGRALAKRPEERYATCLEFVDALRDALGLAPRESGRNAVPPLNRAPTEAVTPVRPQPAVRTAAAVPGRRRAWPLIFAGASVVAAAAIVTGAFLFRPAARSTGAPSPRAGSATSARPGRSRPAKSAGAAGGGGTARFAFARVLDPPGASLGVNALAFSPGGLLATGGADGRVRLWNPATGKIVRTFSDPGSHGVLAVAFSPSGRTLAAGDGSGSAYLWDPATGKLTGTLADPGSRGVFAVAFSPSGRTLAAGDDNGSTYLWDLASGSQIAALRDPGSGGVNTLAFSPSGRTLAAGDYNGTTYLWNVARGTRTAALPVPYSSHDSVTAVAFSPNGRTVATGSYDGSAYLWRASGAAQVPVVLRDPGPVSGVEALAFSPGGKTLATGDVSGSTYLWRLADFGLAQTLTTPAGQAKVWAVAFSPGGRTLAVADHGGVTYLWQQSP